MNRIITPSHLRRCACTADSLDRRKPHGGNNNGIMTIGFTRIRISVSGHQLAWTAVHNSSAYYSPNRIAPLGPDSVHVKSTTVWISPTERSKHDSRDLLKNHVVLLSLFFVCLLVNNITWPRGTRILWSKYTERHLFQNHVVFWPYNKKIYILLINNFFSFLNNV